MRFTRERYQSGCLTREERKVGPSVWIFRWRENRGEGRVNRKMVVGTVEQYPNKTAALKAVESLRCNINSEIPAPLTVDQLTRHYMVKELSKKAFSTSQVCRVYLETWILPKWGEFRPSDVKAVAVEAWLHNLPLANGSKAKIRNIMSALFNHAIRHEWLVRNAITYVRQSAKRQRIPDILDVEELKKLLSELSQPCLTMVFLAATTGLRRSELLALKWRDIQFVTGEIMLSRAIVQQVVGEMKTEASQKPIPMDKTLAEALWAWNAQSPYGASEDWVFASPKMQGRQPYWPENLLRRHIRPAAQRAGITKVVGWHSFRRTFATMLKGGGEDVKTTQELMRHANSRITLDVYAQALTPAKRSAQRKVVELIRPAAAVTLSEHEQSSFLFPRENPYSL
jgi:integrase